MLKATLGIMGLALSVSAGTITSSASCTASVSGSSPVMTSGPLSCVADATASGSAESSHASVSLSTSGNSVSVTIAATRNLFGASFATGSISESELILSDGAPRSGFVVLTFSGKQDCPECTALAGASFDQYSASWQHGTCAFGGPLNTCSGSSITVPITLGIINTLSMNALAFGDGASNALGNASAGISFQFFEADGVTQVRYSDVTDAPSVATPEPGSLFLSGVGLLLLAGVSKRRVFCRKLLR
jgi:hypothetical protein